MSFRLEALAITDDKRLFHEMSQFHTSPKCLFSLTLFIYKMVLEGKIMSIIPIRP